MKPNLRLSDQTTLVIWIRALLVVAGVTTAPLCWAQDGPVAWWRFDEADGTVAVDSSGNGHDGTLVGDAVLDPGGGAFGGAVSLDGDGDAVEVPDADDLEFPAGQDFTITVFFNGPDTNVNDGLVTKGYGDNSRSADGYYLLQVTDPGQFEIDSRCCSGDTPRVRSGQVGPSIVDGNWHNITVVRDYDSGLDGEIRTYIDGALEHTIAMVAGGQGDWNMGVNDDILQIGNHFNRYTAGKIDDVALWRRALSEGEVDTLAQGGVAATLGAVAIFFTPSPAAVLSGSAATLNWRVDPGATVTIDQGIGDVTGMTDGEGNGSLAVNPTETTVYTLTAEKGGTVEMLEARVSVRLIDSFQSSVGAVSQGDSVTLSWVVSPTGSVSIEPGIGNVDGQTTEGVGSIEVVPSGSTTYTLTVSQGGVERSAELTVNTIDTTDGPIAYWPFDEESGTIAADLSGSATDHPAELFGGVTFVPGEGRFGGAVSFDGSSGEVRAHDHEDYEFEQGQDFSITLCYQGPDTNTNDGLITKGYGDNPRSNDGYWLLMVTDNGSYEFDSRCCAGGTPRARTGTGGPSVADGEWHNITLVRDYGTGEIRSYIDGVLTNTIAINPTDGGDWNMGVNDEDVVIGDHLERFTAGKIDEVAIWRRVLAENEIAEIVTNGVAGSIGKQRFFFDVESAPGDMLTLRWASQDGKLYTVRSEASLSGDPLDWPVFEGNQDLAATPPENSLTVPRPDDGQRYFAIEEFNAPPVAIFEDDFESGIGEWTTGSEGVDGTAWELGTPVNSGPDGANSPVNAFGTNISGNYNFDAVVWLRSRTIDLTSTADATLSYAEFRDIEEGFDFGTVRVLDASDDSELAVIDAVVDGVSLDWATVSHRLPPAALGKSVKIEFRFTSDDIGNFAGWYLDDVAVTVP